MNSTIELIVELIVGVISLFAAGHALSRVIGSDEYYDNILCDDDDFITNKNNDVSDDNSDIIHHISI